MRKFLTTATLVMCCAPLVAGAADNTWQGLNYNTGSTATDINDGANWSEGTVPTTGDKAIFEFYHDNEGDLFIDATHTDFNPSAFEFKANLGQWYNADKDLYLDKSLTLTDGMFLDARGSGGGGTVRQDRFRIGTQAMGVTLNVDHIDMTAQTPCWGFFRLGAGDQDPGNSTVINITGASQVFDTPTNSGDNSSMHVSGGSAQENPTNDLNPQLRFTNVGGSVHLASAGQRTEGAIALGAVHLDARSDQTWTADDTAFITMDGSAGASGMAGKYLVESIDGGRLDNLGDLNIKIYGNQGSSAGSSNAMRLMGGTYGSLWMHSTGTSGRDQRIRMTGDVTFMKQSVSFDGDGNPYQNGYGLTLQNNEGNSDTQIFYTDGFALTVESSVKLIDTAGGVTQSYNIDSVLIAAENSTMVVKGDVLMDAPNGRGPEAPANDPSHLVQTNIGIDGGANGMNLTVGGNWDVRTHSRNGGSGLAFSTMTLTGDAKTFEVGDEASMTGVQTSSWSIGTLNIGDGVNNALVQLVNDHLNDNAVTATGELDTDRDGEKLIVGTLNINANATLDVNGQVVEISDSTLNIDAAGVLDLNTGLSLVGGELISNFVGLSDQTAAWNALAALVIDSSSPGITFEAVLDSGNTIWQAVGAGPAVLLGDANNDGVVSADDFAAVQTNFGNTGAADGLLPGDANDDGVVSADDFAAIQTNFGNVLGAATEAAPVPEPATLTLLALGGLAAIRRKRA